MSNSNPFNSIPAAPSANPFEAVPQPSSNPFSDVAQPSTEFGAGAETGTGITGEGAKDFAISIIGAIADNMPFVKAKITPEISRQVLSEVQNDYEKATGGVILSMQSNDNKPFETLEILVGKGKTKSPKAIKDILEKTDKNGNPVKGHLTETQLKFLSEMLYGKGATSPVTKLIANPRKFEIKKTPLTTPKYFVVRVTLGSLQQERKRYLDTLSTLNTSVSSAVNQTIFILTRGISFETLNSQVDVPEIIFLCTKEGIKTLQALFNLDITDTFKVYGLNVTSGVQTEIGDCIVIPVENTNKDGQKVIKTAISFTDINLDTTVTARSYKSVLDLNPASGFEKFPILPAWDLNSNFYKNYIGTEDDKATMSPEELDALYRAGDYRTGTFKGLNIFGKLEVTKKSGVSSLSPTDEKFLRDIDDYVTLGDISVENINTQEKAARKKATILKLNDEKLIKFCKALNLDMQTVLMTVNLIGNKATKTKATSGTKIKSVSDIIKRISGAKLDYSFEDEKRYNDEAAARKAKRIENMKNNHNK